MDPIYIGVDNDVVVRGFYNSGAGNYLNSATVTWALKNSSGTSLATGSCSYVSASNGNYRGTIDSTDTASLTENATYYVEVTLTEGSITDFRRQRKTARYRGDQ